jgi:hypothetical protein
VRILKPPHIGAQLERDLPAGIPLELSEKKENELMTTECPSSTTVSAAARDGNSKSCGKDYEPKIPALLGHGNPP